MTSKTHYRVTIETIGSPYDESTTRAGDTAADALAMALQDHRWNLVGCPFLALAEAARHLSDRTSVPEDAKAFVQAAKKIGR